MLPAYTLRPLLRYFDAVDEIVSFGLVTAKPHPEWSLTSDLCSLMDEHEQTRYALRHTSDWLRNELAERMPAMDIEFAIDTLEYPSHLENLVTQADLGLVVEFVDTVVSDRNWEAAALFQAKRLTKKTSAVAYSGGNGYGAQDRDQHNRISALHELIGYDIVRYLLYTPRPSDLEETLAAELRYRRDVNIAHHIYDYAAGLTVHHELTRRRRFLDGGVVVSPVEPQPADLRGTYDRLLDDSLTWAWFLSLLLIGPYGFDFPGLGVLPKRISSSSVSTTSISPILLAGGDHATATAVAEQLRDRQINPFPMLPARTIRIRIVTGVDPRELATARRRR